MRKPIQIIIEQESEDNFRGIWAVCDDGTIWRYGFDYKTKCDAWVRLPTIPQDDQRSDANV